MKSIIERNLNSILLLSVLMGLFIPGVELIPNNLVTLLLAIMVLFLCSKIDLSELKDIPIKGVIVFYIIRFILLPILLFYTANWLMPRYAIGVLLLSLLPVGITTPMLVANAKGNVTFSLALTVTTSLLAPLMIPLIFMVIGLSGELEIEGLFTTLFSIIIIPLTLYYLLVGVKKELKGFFYTYSSVVSIVLLVIIVAIVIAKQKDVFLNDIFALLLSTLVLIVVFFLFYLLGWFYPMKREQPGFIVCNSLSSGAINTALGINLALLYFSTDTLFFMVVSEFIWVAAIPLFNQIRKSVLI